jgi:hypothetical protein
VPSIIKSSFRLGQRSRDACCSAIDGWSGCLAAGHIETLLSATRGPFSWNLHKQSDSPTVPSSPRSPTVVEGFLTYIRGVSRWRLIAWLIGIVLIYLDGDWPLSGPGVIGAILVVVSIFRWPWGPGAYRLRCARTVSDAAQAIEGANRRLQEQQKQDIGEFLRLPCLIT